MQEGTHLPEGRFTVKDFLDLTSGRKAKGGNVSETSKVPRVLAGDKPDITPAQIASGGVVAAAGLAGYAAGMRGVDFYVFLGCATVFACVALYCDAKIRGDRNASTTSIIGLDEAFGDEEFTDE